MERKQLVVVGAGAAGTSAAIEAAKAGLDVTLIDENPLDSSMMALDVPLMFGERFINTVRNRALMLERYVSSSDLLPGAEEAGVNVQLGISVWGSFKNEEHSYQHEAPVLGLADQDHSWMIEYERLILAPGARDLALAIKGWDSAGVLGAGALLQPGYQIPGALVPEAGDPGVRRFWACRLPPWRQAVAWRSRA